METDKREKFRVTLPPARYVCIQLWTLCMARTGAGDGNINISSEFCVTFLLLVCLPAGQHWDGHLLSAMAEAVEMEWQRILLTRRTGPFDRGQSDSNRFSATWMAGIAFLDTQFPIFILVLPVSSALFSKGPGHVLSSVRPREYAHKGRSQAMRIGAPFSLTSGA